ncbi:hypothetical protein H109_06783 [Trichophyton interdigitale MR816]|uniref:Rab-GAP TBC domain-containing protein n=1 Tax=Trichophyton interdigitale (strain MR816) TaxID=1215338 RepID=A0A059J1A1_TRIIM|nr:hypothetical protein H109_06783 [Trichophyton interdigitale MR816]
MITQRGGGSAHSRRPSADTRTASQAAASPAPAPSPAPSPAPASSTSSASSSPSLSPAVRKGASSPPSVRQRLRPLRQQQHHHQHPPGALRKASYTASFTESPTQIQPADGADHVWPAAASRSGSPAATAPASGSASGGHHQPYQHHQHHQHRYYQRPYHSPQPRLKPSPSMPNVRQKSYSPFQADKPSPRSSPMALSPSRPNHHRYYTPELHFDIPPPSRTSLQSSMTVASSVEQTSGTERSSVATKTSSTTELSPKISEEAQGKQGDHGQEDQLLQSQTDQLQGTHGYGDMSVDDAIDMYLDGFADDPAPGSPAKRKSAALVRALLSTDACEDTSNTHHTHNTTIKPASTPPDTPEPESLTPGNFNSADFNFNFAPSQPAASDKSPSPRPQTALPSPSASPPPPPAPAATPTTTTTAAATTSSADMQPPQKQLQPPLIDISISSEPPPLLKPTKTRDQYGFRKATTHVTVEQYDSWYQSYAEYQKIRSEKWYALLKASGIDEAVPTTFPIRSAKLKKYIRKGIPPECRGAAWFWYAGGYDYIRRNPGLYRRLVETALRSPMNDDKEHIERDLHRTFPDNVHYKPDSSEDGASNSGSSNLKHSSSSPDTPIIQSLRRVLYAFSLHNSNIGYTQSLNFIAGFLILFLPEEKAFWLLHIITSSFFPGTHEISLEGANADLWILMVALKESLPSVYTKVVSTAPTTSRSKPPNLSTSTRLPDITLGLTNWLMSMFISTLPFETTLRVWDVLFYEGSRTFFRVALSIFRMNQKQIVSLGDPMEIFQVVQTAPKRMIDPNELMMDCFARRFKLSQARVETLRQARRAAIREGKDRLSQLAGPRKFKTDPSSRPSTGANNSSPSAWRSFKSFKQ